MAWTVGTNTSRSSSASSSGVPSGAGQYAPMPPVFGPLSPSKAALWSWDGGSGRIVRPLTSASTLELLALQPLLDDDLPAGGLAELLVGP